LIFARARRCSPCWRQSRRMRWPRRRLPSSSAAGGLASGSPRPLSAGRGRRRTTSCLRAGSSPSSSGSRSTRRSPFSCGSSGRRSPTGPSRYEHLCSRWYWCHGWSSWLCLRSSASFDLGCVGADPVTRNPVPNRKERRGSPSTTASPQPLPVSQGRARSAGHRYSRPSVGQTA